MEEPSRAPKWYPVEAQDRCPLARAAPPLRTPWQTCYDRFVRWRRDGTWERLLSEVQTKSDAVGEVEWLVSVDSTVLRAHQHASGARRKPSLLDDEKGG